MNIELLNAAEKNRDAFGRCSRLLNDLETIGKKLKTSDLEGVLTSYNFRFLPNEYKEMIIQAASQSAERIVANIAEGVQKEMDELDKEFEAL